MCKDQRRGAAVVRRGLRCGLGSSCPIPSISPWGQGNTGRVSEWHVRQTDRPSKLVGLTSASFHFQGSQEEDAQFRADDAKQLG